MPADRIASLEALPGWTWDKLGAEWEQGFSFMHRFVEREGHTRVPAGHREDGFPLGAWVKNKRTTYRRARLSMDRAGLDALPGWTADRVARLEALPGWTWDAKKSSLPSSES